MLAYITPYDSYIQLYVLFSHNPSTVQGEFDLGSYSNQICEYTPIHCTKEKCNNKKSCNIYKNWNCVVHILHILVNKFYFMVSKQHIEREKGNKIII